MRHRGPDGEGTFIDPAGGLVLEACRLAIIDPENHGADQPFSDPSGRWTIAYNGEIFNFRELRSELEREGVSFRTSSDTEVVLHACIQWGEDMLDRLRGMFAFLIWDRKARELFGARDQVGVKPLYYRFENGTFVAASELRTVLGHPDVRAELDRESVVEYLAFGACSGDRTIVEGVRQLPPGHSLRLRDGRVDVKEWWDVLPPPGRNGNLGELLEESVSSALVSDVPVGLMLSGGLDSSTIAVLAARSSAPASLTSYSVSFGLPSDESPTAERLASELGFRHRTIALTRDRLVEEFDSWLERIDTPTGNPTWIAVSAIARAARADGIKVLLSGDGGDELFGGYDRWMKYLKFHDRVWRVAPRGVRRMAGKVARPLLRGLAGDIARRAAHDGDLFVGSRPLHDDDLERVLRPGARVGDPERPLSELRDRFDRRLPNADYLAWMSYVGTKRHLVDDYLARLDKMGMGESVEGRVPLLDPGLVRYAFGLDQRTKVNGYVQKSLFRKAVSGWLPDYVLERPKQGFCPPVAAWASSMFRERLPSSSMLVEQGLLDPAGIEHLRRDPSTGAAFALWTVGTLTAWCERNLGL
jgi:asparagine synthase (glutamine-hydrolysing)